ncbi:MAG: AhpC/TSA family protein [Bacteroidales bacterium]|nr:AhpC/TSA family protein [Bacteroidales bacterium]
MNKYLMIIVIVLAGIACTRDNHFVVNGVVKETTGDKIYIKQADINTQVLLDSSAIDKRGSFKFRVKTTEPDFYQLGYSDTDFITLLAEPGENIRLEFGGPTLSGNYNVSGSEGSELVKDLDYQLIRTKTRLDSINAVYEKIAGEPGTDAQKTALEQAYLNLIKEQRKFNIAFIINNLSSLAAIKALYQKVDDQMYVLYETRDLQYLKIVTDSLKLLYPGSRHTKALMQDFEKEMNAFQMRQIQELTSSLPETKLDPDLKDINGKRVSLSSLRGKYVLLTFWTSESRECVAENLQLKEYYRTYSRRGFEIYQISLDRDESEWKAAVKFDELPWISTREENPGDPVNARLFNVKTLPANYLFDKEGKIIASNLHGRPLQIKLNQLFNN